MKYRNALLTTDRYLHYQWSDNHLLQIATRSQLLAQLNKESAVERQTFSVRTYVLEIYIHMYVCSSPGCDHSESLGGAGYCSGAAQVALKGGIPEQNSDQGRHK